MATNAVNQGARQVVLLGAGFDSRAYRLAAMKAVPVYEVDHPTTSARKRLLAGKVLGTTPTHVHYTALDFNTGRLETALEDAGYTFGMQTLFIWEGVTNYLESHAVDETFRTCVKARKESRIIFTYVDRKVLTNPEAYPGTQRIAGVLQKAREKWTFGLDPAELAAYLAEKGLQLETDVSAEEYRSRYYGERSRGMKGYEFYRVAMARVTL